MDNDVISSPDAERNKAKDGVAKWFCKLLRKRRTIIFTMQVLQCIVMLARALKALLGSP